MITEIISTNMEYLAIHYFCLRNSHLSGLDLSQTTVSQGTEYNCITSHIFTSFLDHFWRPPVLLIAEFWSSPQQCGGQVPVALILLSRHTYRPPGIHTLPHPSLNNFLLPSVYLQFRYCPAHGHSGTELYSLVRLVTYISYRGQAKIHFQSREDP